MMLQRLLGTAVVVLAALAGQAQLVVSNTLTPEQLVQDVLIGTCVTASNVTYNGSPGTDPSGVTAGSFISTSTALGIGAGVILASGDVNLAGLPESMFASTMPGTGSDADLELLSGQEISDRSVLEFDFVPTGDSITFRFIFASEEYPGFECSQWNDAFGFFLSGPGISGPFSNGAMNLALVPGTTVPITINTVNSGLDDDFDNYCADADPNWQDNSQYYYSNADGPHVTYYGFTTVLTARAAVQCNQPYHIKLAIGDGSDDAYDSAVFLEAGSFVSEPFIPALAPGAGVIGSAMLESCFPYTMGFIRTSCDLSATQTVHLSYGGSAEMGVDLQPAFPDSLVFGPGVELIEVEFQVPQDPDDLEFVDITTRTIDCQGNPATAIFTFGIGSAAPIEVEEQVEVVACGQSVTFAPLVTGGFGQYQYQWSNGAQGDSIVVTPTEALTLELVVNDLCETSGSGTQQVSLSPAPNFNMTVFGPGDLREGCDNGTLSLIRPQGVLGPYTIVFQTSGTATLNEDHTMASETVIPAGVFSIQHPILVLEDDEAEGDEVITITGTATNACAQTVTRTVSLDILNVDAFNVSVPTVLIACSEGDSLELVPVVEGGVAPYQYLWEDGEETRALWVRLQDEATYPLTVTDACGREANATGAIQLDCLVEIPNVFSPNNDGKNDRWVIGGLGSRPNTVKVFNRWGTAVLDVSNYRNTFAAQGVPDGTYFYEIVIEGKEKPYTGHLTILRN